MRVARSSHVASARRGRHLRVRLAPPRAWRRAFRTTAASASRVYLVPPIFDGIQAGARVHARVGDVHELDAQGRVGQGARGFGPRRARPRPRGAWRSTSGFLSRAISRRLSTLRPGGGDCASARTGARERNAGSRPTRPAKGRSQESGSRAANGQCWRHGTSGCDDGRPRTPRTGCITGRSDAQDAEEDGGGRRCRSGREAPCGARVGRRRPLKAVSRRRAGPAVSRMAGAGRRVVEGGVAVLAMPFAEIGVDHGAVRVHGAAAAFVVSHHFRRRGLPVPSQAYADTANCAKTSANAAKKAAKVRRRRVMVGKYAL